MISNAVKYVILDVIATGLAKGESVEEILEAYSQLSEEDKMEIIESIKTS